MTQDSYYIEAPKLNPYPGPVSVVIMDNCAIHHNEDIWQIIEDNCGTTPSDFFLFYVHQTLQEQSSCIFLLTHLT